MDKCIDIKITVAVVYKEYEVKGVPCEPGLRKQTKAFKEKNIQK